MKFKRSCPSATKDSRLLLQRRRNNTLRFCPCASKKLCSFTLFQQQIFLRLINNVVVGVAVVVAATQQDLIWVTQQDARVWWFFLTRNQLETVFLSVPSSFLSSFVPQPNLSPLWCHGLVTAHPPPTPLPGIGSAPCFCALSKHAAKASPSWIPAEYSRRL